jgi:hypothetical protein
VLFAIGVFIMAAFIRAAPNTSAPIRIAALMTVTTLGQAIWRALVGEGCELMGPSPLG